MSNPRTQQDWQAMAGTLSIRTQAFIDGKYVDAASGKTFDCVSPIDGRVLGQVADGQEEDINRAVAAARRSFDAGAWSNARPTHRKKVLLKLTQLIEQHADELALLESLDMGKPVKIVDLAKNMIRLSGLEPDKDIKIKFTGLRPGEKLFEELLAAEEGTVATQNKKIYQAIIKDQDPEILRPKLHELLRCMDSERCIKLLQDLIPTYKPNHF